jgi:hypothetical protein
MALEQQYKSFRRDETRRVEEDDGDAEMRDAGESDEKLLHAVYFIK